MLLLQAKRAATSAPAFAATILGEVTPDVSALPSFVVVGVLAPRESVTRETKHRSGAALCHDIFSAPRSNQFSCEVAHPTGKRWISSCGAAQFRS
jgi:hypothetical protein